MATTSKLRGNLGVVDSGIPHEMSSGELITFYRDWAKDYDSDTATQMYVAPRKAAEKLVEYLSSAHESKDVKLMDLGAGTGIVAVSLKEEGYHNIDALDISQEMLDIAEAKGLYKNLYCQSLGEGKLSTMDSVYDGVISVGLFTVGHVKPVGFEDAVKMTKQNGIIVFTVRLDAFVNNEYGYADKIKELEDSKIWKVLEHKEIDYLGGYTDPQKKRGVLYVCQKGLNHVQL